ncbi:glycosyltransferase family 4 protein [Aquihabitans sp. McL0605]|uniref:glycosyltransferase family 4 protein n=1 Tax=Aquihabitans sp. McL0605 TaxID=3415671 RepID=UPI003CF9D4C9
MASTTLQVLGPSAGGIRRHVATLAEGLEARGHAVTVAGPAGVMDGLREGAVAVPVGLGPSAVAAVRQLRPLVHQADVVHAHGLTAGWVAWAAGAGSKLVVTVHNLVLDEAAGPSAPVLRRLEGRLPGRAQETIVISEQMRARFDPQGTDPHLHLIPPVAPTPVVTRDRAAVRTELGVPDGVPLIVLVGRLHPQKDIPTLLRAVPSIADDVRVAIVGEGPQRDDLLEQIETGGLAGLVQLVGAKPDAANYFAAADVAVMCSIWEGFGLVVAEALHLARPVVATDVGPVSTMVVDGETGFLVPPSDPPALAAAISAALADPDHAAELGRAGAKLVAPHFDTGALIAKVEDVYDLVTKQSVR